MPCYHPMERWLEIRHQDHIIDWSSGKPETYNRTTGHKEDVSWIERNIDQKTSRGHRREDCFVEYIKCNRCIGCRADRQREWAIRQVAESLYHDESYFITLTQDDKHIVYSKKGYPTLEKDRLSKFMKTLRQAIKRKHGKDGLRFYGCGEYGSQMGRPHYHVNVFGLPLAGEEGRIIGTSQNYEPLWNYDIVSNCWGRGHAVVGKLTSESAAYVAGYVAKKLGELPKPEYWEYTGQQPEFTIMSRRPGIGEQYFQDHKEDIYREDLLHLPGIASAKPPKYYDKLYEKSHSLTDIKYKRQKMAIETAKARRRLQSHGTAEYAAIAERAAKSRKNISRPLE